MVYLSYIMVNLDSLRLHELFTAVGQHLVEGKHTAAIVVVGGSTLSLMGIVDRTTQDVDVIARAEMEEGRWHLVAPDPLPQALRKAAERVARDYGLPLDWMNTVVGRQWPFGLPEGFAEEVEWRIFDGLTVGFAGRQSLIALKLFAAVDQGEESVHMQDLVAMSPTHLELEHAAEWVRSQDASEHFPALVQEAVDHVRDRLGRNR